MILFPPNFGQLLLFDDRCPHSVVTVQGASNPMDLARSVGWSFARHDPKGTLISMQWDN